MIYRKGIFRIRKKLISSNLVLLATVSNVCVAALINTDSMLSNAPNSDLQCAEY